MGLLRACSCCRSRSRQLAEASTTTLISPRRWVDSTCARLSSPMLSSCAITPTTCTQLPMSYIAMFDSGLLPLLVGGSGPGVQLLMQLDHVRKLEQATANVTGSLDIQSRDAAS